MRRAFRYALPILMSLTMAPRAWSCGVKITDKIIPLDAAWHARFEEAFSRADGVYLVTVRSGGEFEEPLRASCDTYAHSPWPPPRNADSVQKEAYAAMERAADSARVACQAEKADIHVIETIKGPPRDGWVEAVGLIDVRQGAAKEPVAWYDETPAYGADVASMDRWRCEPLWVRRMSAGAPYVVFTTPAWEETNQPAHVTHAFWAAPDTPFLSEARRLQSQPVR